MSKIRSRESSGPKLQGAGDGLKTPSVHHRTSERVPVPSARKFTATPHREGTAVQLKLKKALDDIEAKQTKLQKSKSIAEITPTKTKPKRSKCNNKDAAGSQRGGITLHATPRPLLMDDVRTTPSGHDDEEERRRRRLGLMVYRRLLLSVWRRNRARLTMLSESLRRRQDQVTNLEKQVDCLKNLTQAECNKRNEAINDYQQMKTALETVQCENLLLQKDKVLLESELNVLRESVDVLNVEIENLRNEFNTKTMKLQRLDEEYRKENLVLHKLKDERSELIAKMKVQDGNVKLHEETIRKLEEALKNAEYQIKSMQNIVSEQTRSYEELQRQYQSEVNKAQKLGSQSLEFFTLKTELECKIDSLEKNLIVVNENYDRILQENVYLRRDLTEFNRQCWWKSAKDFMIVSWAVLQNAAYIMLPAL